MSMARKMAQIFAKRRVGILQNMTKIHRHRQRSGIRVQKKLREWMRCALSRLPINRHRRYWKCVCCVQQSNNKHVFFFALAPNRMMWKSIFFFAMRTIDAKAKRNELKSHNSNCIIVLTQTNAPKMTTNGEVKMLSNVRLLNCWCPIWNEIKTTRFYCDGQSCRKV